jgi:hypothetical protein
MSIAAIQYFQKKNTPPQRLAVPDETQSKNRDGFFSSQSSMTRQVTPRSEFTLKNYPNLLAPPYLVFPEILQNQSCGIRCVLDARIKGTLVYIDQFIDFHHSGMDFGFKSVFQKNFLEKPFFSSMKSPSCATYPH